MLIGTQGDSFPITESFARNSVLWDSRSAGTSGAANTSVYTNLYAAAGLQYEFFDTQYRVLLVGVNASGSTVMWSTKMGETSGTLYRRVGDTGAWTTMAVIGTQAANTIDAMHAPESGNWTKTPVPASGAYLDESVLFCITGGPDRVLRSTDGGTTWVDTKPPSMQGIPNQTSNITKDVSGDYYMSEYAGGQSLNADKIWKSVAPNKGASGSWALFYSPAQISPDNRHLHGFIINEPNMYLLMGDNYGYRQMRQISNYSTLSTTGDTVAQTGAVWNDTATVLTTGFYQWVGGAVTEDGYYTSAQDQSPGEWNVLQLASGTASSGVFIRSVFPDFNRGTTTKTQLFGFAARKFGNTWYALGQNSGVSQPKWGVFAAPSGLAANSYTSIFTITDTNTGSTTVGPRMFAGMDANGWVYVSDAGASANWSPTASGTHRFKCNRVVPVKSQLLTPAIGISAGTFNNLSYASTGTVVNMGFENANTLAGWTKSGGNNPFTSGTTAGLAYSGSGYLSCISTDVTGDMSINSNNLVLTDMGVVSGDVLSISMMVNVVSVTDAASDGSLSFRADFRNSSQQSIQAFTDFTLMAVTIVMPTNGWRRFHGSVTVPGTGGLASGSATFLRIYLRNYKVAGEWRVDNIMLNQGSYPLPYTDVAVPKSVATYTASSVNWAAAGNSFTLATRVQPNTNNTTALSGVLLSTKSTNSEYAYIMLNNTGSFIGVTVDSTGGVASGSIATSGTFLMDLWDRPYPVIRFDSTTSTFRFSMFRAGASGSVHANVSAPTITSFAAVSSYPGYNIQTAGDGFPGHYGAARVLNRYMTDAQLADHIHNNPHFFNVT